MTQSNYSNSEIANSTKQYSNSKDIENPSKQQEKFKFNFCQMVKAIGPGLLISIAYLDPGNLAGDMDAGLTAKYGLLWSLFYATFLGWVFQVYSLILGIRTGKDMAQLCRLYYSKKTSILLWIMAEIAIIGSDIQEVLGSAIALNILFGLDLWIGVILTITSTLLILLLKAYGMKLIEIIFAVLIAIMAIAFFINLGYVEPSFAKIMEGIAVPQIPSGSKVALVGLIGSVLMPHNLYLHSSLVNEKDIKQSNIQASHSKSVALRMKERIIYNSIETGFSLFVSFLINLAVICTFAHYYGQDDLNLQTAATVLEKEFGKAAKYIWGIGLLAAGQSSTLSGTLAGQYIMEGFVHIKVSKFKRALITRSIAIIPALVISFLSDPNAFNDYLNVLQAIQLPFAVIPLMKFSINKNIMKEKTMNMIIFWILIIFSVLVVGMNYYGSLPSKIDWKEAWIYIFIVVALFYFAFMFLITFSKLNPENLSQIKLKEIEEEGSDEQEDSDIQQSLVEKKDNINQENQY